jgi:predicted nucleic acid-binding protein
MSLLWGFGKIVRISPTAQHGFVTFANGSGEVDVTQLILVDTDIVIDAGRKVTEAIDCLQHIEQRAMLSVSVITEMEVMVGCRNRREFRILERFLRRFEIVSLNEAIADVGVALLRRYRLSHGLLIADALIAATALTVETDMVTKNQRDYRLIEGLKLLPYPHVFV